MLRRREKRRMMMMISSDLFSSVVICHYATVTTVNDTFNATGSSKHNTAHITYTLRNGPTSPDVLFVVVVVDDVKDEDE